MYEINSKKEILKSNLIIVFTRILYIILKLTKFYFNILHKIKYKNKT